MIDFQALKDAQAVRNETAFYDGLHTRIRQPAHAVRVIEVCDGETVVEAVEVTGEERLPMILILFGLRGKYEIEGYERE